MREIYRALGTAAGIAILSACTSGQSGIEPTVTSVNPQTTTSLQFRVGTAHFANGSVYLNTVATYRQANGLSGTLYNSPTITGPAGFVVPAAGSAGTDAGTNHISSTPPTQPGTTAVVTTFNQSGGVFSYGFAPANATTTRRGELRAVLGGGRKQRALCRRPEHDHRRLAGVDREHVEEHCNPRLRRTRRGRDRGCVHATVLHHGGE